MQNFVAWHWILLTLLQRAAARQAAGHAGRQSICLRSIQYVVVSAKCWASKETSPQSPNASGTTNSSTNKEERVMSGRASSTTPPFKLGEELKKTSEEKLKEKRKPLTQQPYTPPPDLHLSPSPNPTIPKMHKTLPRTSNGTGDHPRQPLLPKCQRTAR